MTGFAGVAPAIAMAAVLLLVVFGVRMVCLGAERRKGVLMLAAAAVLLGNVVIWTW